MTDTRSGWRLVALAVSTAGLCILVGRAHGGNPKTEYKTDPEYDGVCRKREGKPKGETGKSCGRCAKKDVKCNKLKSMTDCKNQVCWGCEWIASDAPDSVPSLGERIQLSMVVTGHNPGTRWGTHIGFGAGRALNYLSKAHLSSDERYARVFDPDQDAIVCFEREGTSWTYTRTEYDASVGADAEVEFTNVVAGVPQAAKLTFPDGRTWDFEFETQPSQTPTNTVPGMIYRITKRTTRDGFETTVTYNQGNVTITDASSHGYVCSFDGQDRITSIAVNGGTWSYSYDGNTVTETNGRTSGTIATTVNADYEVTAIVENGGSGSGGEDEYRYYDSSSNLTKAVVNGIVTTYSVSKSGNTWTRTINDAGYSSTAIYGLYGLTSEENGLSQVESHTRNYTHQSTSITDARGKTWNYYYDDNGYLTREVDPDSGYTNYVFDGDYNLLTKTTSDGSWTYLYDSNNRVTKQTAPDTGETVFDRDSNGLVTREVNPRGHISLYLYNSSGQMTRMKGPYSGDEPTTFVAYEYDSWGNRTKVIDENTNSTTYGYDSYDRLTSVATTAGTRSYEYDGVGRKTKETDPTDAYTEWYYDTRGFVTKIAGSAAGGGGCSSGCGKASGSGQLGDYYYSDGGKLTKFVDLKSNETVHHYDAAGRRTQTVDPLNYETDYTYDAAGNLLTMTDANDNTTTNTYTDGGRLASVQNGASNTTSYAYDSEGRQTLVTDGAGDTRKTYYNSMGRVTKVEDGLSRATTYLYDLAGNLTRMTDAVGTITDYEYSPEGNVTRTVADSGGLALVTLSYYDPGGRLTRSVDPLSHNTDYLYDGANRLTRVSSHLGNHTDYAHDGLGRQTKVTVGSVSRTTTYNNAGWVTQVSDGVTTTDYCYDDVGNRTLVTVSGRAAVAYCYDDASRLTRGEQSSGGVTLVTEHYPDPVGRRTKVIDPESKATVYAYDGANRVTSVTNAESEETTYAYDGAGRRTLVTFDNGSSRSYVYDDAGQCPPPPADPRARSRILMMMWVGKGPSPTPTRACARPSTTRWVA
jgi:YD repeat-containing protein